jgi:hypothetical protein
MATLPSLAELDELSERLGLQLEPESPDGLRAQRALDDASALIRAEAKTDWPVSIPDVINTITVAVAYRAYRNPDGTAQASVGDVSVSYGGGNVVGDAIYLTPNERRAVRRAAGVSSVGSVPMSSDYLGPRDPMYTPVDLGGDPIPIGPLPWEVG